MCKFKLSKSFKMLKTFLLSALSVLVLGGVSYAAENSVVELDHGKEKPKKEAGLTDNKFDSKIYSFSLRSKKQWRGETIFSNANTTNTYINLNTSISYQKGQNTYTVPYKKKVILNRFTFNPNEALRNYSR